MPLLEDSSKKANGPAEVQGNCLGRQGEGRPREDPPPIRGRDEERDRIESGREERTRGGGVESPSQGKTQVFRKSERKNHDPLTREGEQDRLTVTDRSPAASSVSNEGETKGSEMGR